MAIPNILGGDPPAMQALAGKLESVSGRLGAMRAKLSRELAGLEWVGVDATRFRGEWSGTYAPALQRMVEDLSRAGRDMRGEADKQIRASGPSGGGGGGGTW